VSCAKTAEPIDLIFWAVDLGGSKKARVSHSAAILLPYQIFFKPKNCKMSIEDVSKTAFDVNCFQ